MAQTTKYIWFNGELVEWDKAQVHVMTHALHYGSSVFEGIRAYDTPKGTVIFRLKEHIQRLRITSYNVCYTKLLRHPRRAQHSGERQVPGEERVAQESGRIRPAGDLPAEQGRLSRAGTTTGSSRPANPRELRLPFVFRAS